MFLLIEHRVSEIHPDTENVLGKKLRTGDIFVLFQHRAALGLCTYWVPWGLLAVGKTLPASLDVNLFSPPTTSPTLHCPGYSLFTSHSSGWCLLYSDIVKILFVHASRKRAIAVRFPGCLLFCLLCLGPYPLNPTKAFPPVQSSEPHILHDTPILQDAVLRGHVLSLTL